MASVRRRKREIKFYTYPKLLFAWPLILIGFLLWPISSMESANPETLAWIWAGTLLLVVVTLGIDVNRNQGVFWIISIAAIWILIVWLRDVKELKLFSYVYDFFAGLDPQYSAGLGLGISIPLTLLYGIMWVWTRINSRWRITHNEFEHYQFGKMDDSLARGAKRISTDYPDLFELLLCLAGELVIYDSTGKRVLRRIQNVPFLPFVKQRINKLMEATAVVAAEVEDEADAAEEESF